MAGTQNSISSLVAQFLRLQKNALEIINGLNQVAVSTNNTVSIEILDEQGLPQNANIPSYGYIRGEIQRLDNNIKSLAGIGQNSATVRNPDGTYSQVFKAETLKDPPRLTNLTVPNTFGAKDNWFFESFLSPRLYVNVNVTGQIPEASDRILVKRIIANTETDVQRNYFDQNLKGRNDLTYDQFLSSLGDGGIGYFVDEDIVQLPLRTIRYIGNFSVIGYYDDTVSTTDQADQTFQEIRRNYKLDKLSYTDTLSGIPGGKNLNVGDKIATQDGSLYEITSVNNDQASIQAKRISGYQPIQIGANTISISSTDFGPRYVQIDIGYNERQGVFFKTIDDNFNIVSALWSTGVIFWTNELLTKNSNGDLINLESYYLSEVADFGKMFIGAAKEKKIPAIQGVSPQAPLVTSESFKVVQINKQITDSTSVKVVEDKLNLKTTLKSEIDSLDAAINDARLQLNTGLSRRTLTSSYRKSDVGDGINSGADRLTVDLFSVTDLNSPLGVNQDAIKANLDSLIEQRTKKAQLYASLVEEVSTLVKDVPQIITPPKYRVRGFWPIPQPKIDPATGAQNVIQFSVRYRYLSDGGAAQPSSQIEYVDNDGLRKSGSFSNWTEYKTDIRKKVYDPNRGIYVWADEITSDADIQNINQLDIPITKGERVEIQIQSISEAGWPDNPLISDYSKSAIVGFPDDLAVTGLADPISQNNEDNAVVKVQSSLNAQGLPLHLSQQFTSGDKNYFHDASGIASGFYTSNGSVINLFEKLAQMQAQINSLTAQISGAKGILEIYILDKNNNRTKISKGSTINLIAGFYNDIFSDALNADAGRIASVVYSIQLYNSKASIVELSSIIPGGLAVKAPSTISPQSYPVGYDDNLRYGDCPISISSLVLTDPSIISNQSFRQAPPFASASAYSQYVYIRYKSVGYDQQLYTGQGLGSVFSSNFSSSYAYDGALTTTNFGITTTYPQNGTIMIPYNPTSTPTTVQGATGTNIWDGTYSGTTGGTPNGGGNISEFCIDVRHPYLRTVGNNNSFVSYDDLVKPYASNSKVYPPFRHTQTFWGDTTLDYYWAQQSYRTPITFASGATAARDDRMYPDKLGFSGNDEYLIGKYSCGAYLYLAPPNASSVQVSGNTSLSTKQLSEGEANAINIPLVFQFRCVDKAGYIGGWRKSGNLSNITYIKKIGIDIQVQNEDSFSFDVQVSGSFKNDTLVAPNFDSGYAIV
jgi:hypothetical protein